MVQHDPHLSNLITNPERASLLDDRIVCRLGDVARRLSWIACSFLILPPLHNLQADISQRTFDANL